MCGLRLRVCSAEAGAHGLLVELLCSWEVGGRGGLSVPRSLCSWEVPSGSPVLGCLPSGLGLRATTADGIHCAFPASQALWKHLVRVHTSS